MKYSEKLKDPRWQKKRLEILQRDEWTCQNCFDTENTLAVHHLRYLPGCEPWDHPDCLLLTLCEECHRYERENRGAAEYDLLEILKANKFLADDVKVIAAAFMWENDPPHIPSVVATAIKWAFQDSDELTGIINRYLDALKARRHPETDKGGE